MLELLAPAGDMECLKAAVSAGADAVYCGGKSFSARSYAGNFDRDEMAEAVSYCHVRGKKIYAALNTMIKEREMGEALEEASYLSSIGTDALIVSDIGLASRIIGCLGVPVHASTQMCIHDAAGAELLGKMGFKRVVPSRELSLDEIKDICAKGIETEVFVHGALCSSVSGLCLLSSFIGQRSGNRGCCAQPCRLKFTAGGEEGYLLSTADLCLARHLDELGSAGVTSLKIEGRMKSPDYVAGVTAVYSDLLKKNIEPGEAVERLEKFYNRTFTDSYLTGGTDVCAPDRPDTRAHGSSAAESNDLKTVFPAGTLEVKEGEKPRFTVSSDGIDVTVTGERELERAAKDIPDASIISSLMKTGGSPFGFKDIKIVREGSPFISRAELNSLRRCALGELSDRITAPYLRPEDAGRTPRSLSADIAHRLTEISVETADAEAAVLALKKGADRVYLAPRSYDETILEDARRIYGETGARPYIKLLPFMRSEGYRTVNNILTGSERLFSGLLAGHFTQIRVFPGFDDIVLDYTANVANGASVEALKGLGVGTVTVSCELAKKDIKHMDSCLRTEMLAYGSLPVMWIAHDVPAAEMTDGKGYRYAFTEYRAGGEVMYSLLNPAKLFIKEISGLAGAVDSLRIIAADRKDTDMIDVFREAVMTGNDIKTGVTGTTQGHLKRGV